MLKSKSYGDIMTYKILKSKSKAIIRKAKSSYWEGHCKTLNYNSKLKMMWNSFKSMKENSSVKAQNIVKDSEHITDVKQIASLFGKHFGSISSNSSIPTEIFNCIK